RQQTAQILGFPAPPIGHPDRYPLHVLQAITSGLGGRWFAEIRSRRGLAYTVSSMVFQGRAAGAFLVFLATAPDRERDARRVLLAEIERLRREGPDEEEIRRAVRFLQGSQLVGLQTGAAVAAALAEAEISGLGYAEEKTYPGRIGAVTRERVNQVIRTCLDPARLRLGILRGSAPA
ncbi:MAG: insulinase family protein, partial [Acidobacteria bacterium]|nr:insulinase family protein [Acidobacteriota bacterium]